MVDNGCWANHGVNHQRLSREPGLGLVGGAREESRTPDLLITSEPLYRLSYSGIGGDEADPPGHPSSHAATPGLRLGHDSRSHERREVGHDRQ